MWPLLMAFLRRNAPYITLPIAAVVGVIGYNLEGLISDRYTPYSKSVVEQRLERQLDKELVDPTNIPKLQLQERILGIPVQRPSTEKEF